jgi:hypothetical protein
MKKLPAGNVTLARKVAVLDALAAVHSDDRYRSE